MQYTLDGGLQLLASFCILSAILLAREVVHDSLIHPSSHAVLLGLFFQS